MWQWLLNVLGIILSAIWAVIWSALVILGNLVSAVWRGIVATFAYLGYLAYLGPVAVVVGLNFIAWDLRESFGWKAFAAAFVIGLLQLWIFTTWFVSAQVDDDLKRKFKFDAPRFVRGLGLANDVDKRTKAITDQLDRLQKRITDEYGDIGARIGWLMGAQALLFGGFVGALKWDDKAANIQQPLLVGMAAGGAVISLTLFHSVFFGHAVAALLKKARSSVEDLAINLGMPQTGVPANSQVHLITHMATRLLPVTMLVAWLTLGATAWHGVLNACVDTKAAHQPLGSRLACDKADPPAAALAIGWEFLDSSPSFDRGKAEIPPDTSEERKAWEDWAHKTVGDWMRRKPGSPNDSMIITGSADRVQLLPGNRRQFGSNMGLARARAEAARQLLESACREAAPKGCVWNIDRIIIETLGPGITPEDNKIANEAEGLADDRRVRVRSPLKQ